MSESPINDVQDLWGIYQTTKTLLNTLQAQIGLIQAALDGVLTVEPGSANDDYLSFARSGTKGSTSWNRQSLLDRQSELTDQLVKVFDTLEKQRLLAIKASPGFTQIPIGRRGRY